jgi:ferric-dicitrate binding protein FerR (iron transport regulator)
VILKPGQQARLTENKWDVVDGIDPEQVVAWKNGLFHFDNEALPGILKQLQRWYDFELVYPSSSITSHYSGVMKRQQHVSQVLSKLEMAGGVKFRIEGKKVIVMNDTE